MTEERTAAAAETEGREPGGAPASEPVVAPELGITPEPVVASEAPVDSHERADRPADHVAIDRLAASLVPELIARLAASGLGEIEIHQDDWKIRVRRPSAARPAGEKSAPRRAAATPHPGPSRPQPGHAGHGHAPAAVERPLDPAHTAGDGATGNGRSPQTGPERVVVTSPAVGVYRPGKVTAGARVRSGDRIGAVDMLGVPQDVIATADGVLGEAFVEPGEAVEYGQELVRIERVEVSA